MTRQAKPAKGGFLIVEQDKQEGAVYSGPDFGVHVDKDLTELRREDKTVSETRRETRETL